MYDNLAPMNMKTALIKPFSNNLRIARTYNTWYRRSAQETFGVSQILKFP